MLALWVDVRDEDVAALRKAGAVLRERPAPLSLTTPITGVRDAMDAAFKDSITKKAGRPPAMPPQPLREC